MTRPEHTVKRWFFGPLYHYLTLLYTILYSLIRYSVNKILQHLTKNKQLHLINLNVGLLRITILHYIPQ